MQKFEIIKNILYYFIIFYFIINVTQYGNIMNGLIPFS